MFFMLLLLWTAYAIDAVVIHVVGVDIVADVIVSAVNSIKTVDIVFSCSYLIRNAVGLIPQKFQYTILNFLLCAAVFYTMP